MDKYSAEELIQRFGAAITSETTIARHESLLPASRARIKWAYFVFVSAIIKEKGGLPMDVGNNLATTYTLLNAFVDDKEADRINSLAAKIQSIQDPAERANIADEIIRFSKKSALNSDSRREFDEFVQEEQNNNDSSVPAN